MSGVEQRILAFTVLLQAERALGEAADMLGDLPSSRIYRTISLLLDIPEGEVRHSLGPHGVLNRTGLVAIDKNGASCLQHKLDIISEGFADRMVSLDADPVVLIRDKVRPAGAPTLQAKDFAHIRAHLDIARAHLAHALSEDRPGTNIFVHGVPGVGKSELVKMMAQEFNIELFEISYEDDDGDPMDGDRRLRAYRAAQWFFSNRRVMFLFDEAEDVFSGGGGMYSPGSSAQRRKAWMNRMLESNPIPTLWVSNKVDCLDPAFVRRFDMVMELPVPPLRQREKIICETAGEWLDEARLKRLASVPHLAPAIVARASSVAKILVKTSGPAQAARSVELLINSTLEAQGLRSIPKPSPSQLPDFYDTNFINADMEPAQLAEQLRAHPSARLCLYGPPGTGKTAYARWVAAQLEKPLLTKRASDLLSMWVGESEKSIAEAFADAERDGAVLLIDEVDSFLQDRRKARNSWEISMANEMLTQMETFSGVFMASTNLMESLDPATLRRFDLKLKFDFLSPQQVWSMFQRLTSVLGLPQPEASLRARAEQHRQIAPGDFAVVVRRHQLKPINGGCELLDALESECKHKELRRNRIGFV